VASKVELAGELSFDRVAGAIDEIEARIRSALPAARVIYVEPAVFNPER
jgi:hypothetical protein